MALSEEPGVTLVQGSNATSERTDLATPTTNAASPRTGSTAHPLLVKGGLVVADAIGLAVAAILSFGWRRALPGPDPSYELAKHLELAALAIPLWLGLFAHRRLYTSRFVARRLDELRRVSSALGTGFVLLAATGYWLQLPVSRAWLVLTAAVGVPLVMAERELARQLFRRARRHGSLLKPVVIVGSNEEAFELASMLIEDQTLGYRVVGFVDDHDQRGGGSLLGAIEETEAVLHRTGACGVIIATSAMSVETCNRLVRRLLATGIHVELSSTLRDISADRLSIRPLGRLPIVYLEPRGVVGWRRAAKRAFDIALAGLILLLVLPVTVVITLLVKLDSRGPVLFRQVRVGKDGVPFKVWKFRTMVVNADDLLIDLRDRNEADGPLFKLRNDPRVTRVGRILRKASLDELPQLVNVLQGHMSIVGPRPALASELEHWEPALHARLLVKPGITGMWQVSGRSDTSFESYTRLDLYYVENWSLITDLAIVAKTVPTVLFGRGAY